MTQQLIPACLYLRMSDDEQTLSIAGQRKELLNWAANMGYRIVQEYVDEGKSGSKKTESEKRTGFQRLLLDSATAEWQAVLCYNSSRFARLDSIDGAFAKNTLRKNDKYLHTKSEGKIDWNTQMGRIHDAFLSEQNHAYSQSISKDSLRGRQQVAEQGYWARGIVPYAYDKRYIQPGGDSMTIPRTQRFVKPRNWRLVLVVNEQEAEIVRYIFDQYVNHDMPILKIAQSLHERNVPIPPDSYRRNSERWSDRAVRGILDTEAYVGAYTFGNESKRKHRSKQHFTRATPTEGGNVPQIIPPALWQAAHKKRQQFAQGRRTKTTSGVLSGILHCGVCGHPLSKRPCLNYFCADCDTPLMRRRSCPTCKGTRRVRKQRPLYLCNSASHALSDCPHWKVYEDEMIPVVCAELQKAVDGKLEKLAALTPDKSAPTNKEILRQQVEALKKKVSEGARRLLLVPAELLADCESELLKLREQLNNAEEQLEQESATEHQGARLQEIWDKHKVVLIRAQDPSFNPPITDLPGKHNHTPVDGEIVRALLKQCGASVVLYWAKNANGTYALDRGRLEFDFDFSALNDGDTGICAPRLHGTVHLTFARKCA